MSEGQQATYSERDLAEAEWKGHVTQSLEAIKAEIAKGHPCIQEKAIAEQSKRLDRGRTVIISIITGCVALFVFFLSTCATHAEQSATTREKVVQHDRQIGQLTESVRDLNEARERDTGLIVEALEELAEEHERGRLGAGGS